MNGGERQERDGSRPRRSSPHISPQSSLFAAVHRGPRLTARALLALTCQDELRRTAADGLTALFQGGGRGFESCRPLSVMSRDIVHRCLATSFVVRSKVPGLSIFTMN